MEQGVGISQVVSDCDRCVDPPHLSEIRFPVRNHGNRLLLCALRSGIFPHGTVFVPEVDFDPQTCQTDLQALQLTSRTNWRNQTYDVDVTLPAGECARTLTMKGNS